MRLNRFRKRVGGAMRRAGRGRVLAVQQLEPRHLLASTGLFESATFSPLVPLPVSANTGEKPQSKTWEYADRWWSVLPNASGTWLWRLDETTWNPVVQLSGATSAHADVKSAGGLAHILLYEGTQSQFISMRYSSEPSPTYIPLLEPTPIDVALSSGVETASIDVDSRGRLWLASDAQSTVEVRYSDFPYTSFSAPIAVATGITSDDIAAVAALPQGAVGVFWSNQNSERFGFRLHQDGDLPTTWAADEVPASQSARSIGDGMADDHLNLAVAQDGTLYAAVKTSYDSGAYPRIALLVRRPNGTWDPLYTVDTRGTRPIVVLNEQANRLIVAYTAAESGGDILFKESPMDVIGFGPVGTLIAGSLNNVTSTKEDFTNDLVVLAEGGGKVRGSLIQWADSGEVPPPASDPLSFVRASSDLGPVALREVPDQDPSRGGLWCELEAVHEGILTVEPSSEDPLGSVHLAVYHVDPSPAATSTMVKLGEADTRLDVDVQAGHTYLVNLSGTSTAVDLRLANLVRRIGSVATVYGTDAADTFELDLSDGARIVIDGVEYDWGAETVSAIGFEGGPGSDAVRFWGGSGVDSVQLWPDHGELFQGTLTATVADVEAVTAYGGPEDQVTFYDRADTSESLVARPTSSTFSGTGFLQKAFGFGVVSAHATAGGKDVAQLYGSTGDDRFQAWPDRAVLESGSVELVASGFRYVHGYGAGGSGDVAHLYDSSGNDALDGCPGCVRLYNQSFFLRAKEFAEVHARASQGDDRATLTDTAGNDSFVGRPTEAILSTDGASVGMENFDRVRVQSSGKGKDTAVLYDSDGDDQFIAGPDYAKMSGPNYFNWVIAFDQVLAYASRGRDTASLVDSPGNDRFEAWEGTARLYGAGFYNRVKGFEQVLATSKRGGRDVATFHDSGSANTFYGTPAQCWLSSAKHEERATAFAEVYALSDSSVDEAMVSALDEDDLLIAEPNRSQLRSNGPAYDRFIELVAYETVRAKSSITGVSKVEMTSGVDYLILTGNWVW